eukprot:COSAG05_NODE_3954_length_1753_cov_1.700726_2_plen_87_part_00
MIGIVIVNAHDAPASIYIYVPVSSIKLVEVTCFMDEKGEGGKNLRKMELSLYTCELCPKIYGGFPGMEISQRSQRSSWETGPKENP